MTYISYLHILIVDDDPICSKILHHIIISLQPLYQNAILEITTVHSAEEALHKLETASYNIIFTDIEMGAMSGDKMAQCIRDKALNNYLKNHNILIYAITCKYDEESLKQYKEVGITQCLEKPVKREFINEIISQLMTSL
jgi:CheY-like chemotaxis protein